MACGWFRRGYRTDNPCAHVRKLAIGEGWEAWPWEMIELVEKHAPKWMWQAVALALYTGQRQGDVLAMTRAKIKNVTLDIDPSQRLRGVSPSLWFNGCRRKVLKKRRQRDALARVSHPLRMELAAQFDSADASSSAEALCLARLARAGRSVLQAFDIGDGTPKVLGRLFVDIENGEGRKTQYSKPTMDLEVTRCIYIMSFRSEPYWLRNS